MKFYKLNDIPNYNVKYTFKTGWLINFVGVLLCLSFIVLPLTGLYELLASFKTDFFLIIPMCVLVIILLFLLIMLSAAFHSAKASLNKANWIVRLLDEGLLIKYRSYLNYHFNDDIACIVFVPKNEIKLIYMLKEKRQSSSNDKYSITYYSTSLNIQLNHTNTKKLKDLLKKELNLRASKTAFNQVTFKSYPVSLSSPDTIRINWHGVRPPIKKALAVLAPYFPLGEEVKDEGMPLEQLNDKNIDDYILKLIESGREIEAINLIRKKYNIGFDEACKLIKELSND